MGDNCITMQIRMHYYSGLSKSSCSKSSGKASVFSHVSSQLVQKSVQLTPLRAQVHLCILQLPENVFLMLTLTCYLKDF